MTRKQFLLDVPAEHYLFFFFLLHATNCGFQDTFSAATFIRATDRGSFQDALAMEHTVFLREKALNLKEILDLVIQLVQKYSIQTFPVATRFYNDPTI